MRKKEDLISSMEKVLSIPEIRKKTVLVLIVITFVMFNAQQILATGIMTDSSANPSTEDIQYLDSLFNINLSSGSFLELDLDKSPMSITIITKDLIKISGARNISELLEIYVPGFQYMFNKWYGTLWGLRGVTSDRNCKLIYLVNGHKLNTQARDGFMSETVLGLLNDIERVEVLRGPAGLVYGSGAIAGIINIVTQKADENKSEVYTSIGMNNSQEIEASFHSKISENQNFSFFAGFRKSDGLPTHQSRVYGLDQWPYPNWLDSKVLKKDGLPSDGNFGSTDGNWKIAGNYSLKNLDLYFRVTRQKENAGGLFIIDPWPELKDNLPTDSLRGNGFVDGQTIKYNDPFWSSAGESKGTNLRQYLVDNIMAQLNYMYPIGTNELKVGFGFDANTTRIGTEQRERYKIESEIHDVIDTTGEKVNYWDSPHAARNPDYIDETFGEKRYTFNAMYLLKSIPRLQLATGLEYRLDQIGNDMTGKNVKSEIARHPVISEIDYNTFTLFSEGFCDITDKIGAHIGGRLDFHTRAFMANPKLALVYSPNSSHSIKMIYQTSSNNGSADNYEYNRYHYDDAGHVKTELSFDRPYEQPGPTTPILPVFPPIEELHQLKPEKVRSAEITSTHKFGNYLTVMPSFAYGHVTDLFSWSQTLFRVVNIGEYKYINLDLDSKFDSKLFKFGINHTFQRPVDLNVKEQQGYFIRPKVNIDQEGWYDSTFDAASNRWKYFPVVSDSVYDTIPINIVKDAITADGENFLNLNTNITKLYMTITPAKWLAFHTNLRLFWGLPGRDGLYSKDTGFNYCNINKSKDDFGWVDYFKKCVSKKVNISTHFYLPSGFEISLLAYDVLGIDRPEDKDTRNLTINTIRWQQMADPGQKALYSTDQRTFALNIAKSF